METKMVNKVILETIIIYTLFIIPIYKNIVT